VVLGSVPWPNLKRMSPSSAPGQPRRSAIGAKQTVLPINEPRQLRLRDRTLVGWLRMSKLDRIRLSRPSDSASATLGREATLELKRHHRA
jgi:hypothetical protein